VLRLRTLGGLSIERIDGPAVSVNTTSSRRGLMLLAVLAASGRPISREALAAMLWPNDDRGDGLAALDRSMDELRRESSVDDLFVGDERLSLAPHAIVSDVAELRDAIAAGTADVVLRLYRGPFLNGVDSGRSPELERWIGEQRAAIASEVETALEQAATDAAAQGDHPAAARWLRAFTAAEARRTGDDHTATPGAARETPSSGRVLLAGRYVVIREIGRGGASTVFLAFDERNERHVALKVLRHELGTGVAAERFRHEIAVTANLQHPHILPVHEWGEADGTLYFAMPFVEGESLRERLERARCLPVTDVVRLAHEVAGALAYAHARGIVHRDVKPENILLTSGLALVADFGIARARDAEDTPDALRRTDPGIILGTPAYLSPEQASGEFEIDARSDQYAMACVLYEALAGGPPFTARRPLELLTQRLESLPPTIRSRRPEVPEHIDRAILRALSINPGHRFASVTDFAAALDAPTADALMDDALHGVPTPAPDDARTTRTAWRDRLLRKRTIAGVAGAMVLAAGTVAWRLATRPALPERAWVVVADVDNQTRDTIFDRALDAALLAGLQQSAYVNVLPRARVDAALQRMRRVDAGDSSRAVAVDERVAREVAEREGVRAVVAASINRVDSSYFVSARVIEVPSGKTLVAERREARGRAEVVSTIDDVVRRLRRGIGESATEIAKHDRPLPLATTRSLDALRKFADGVRASQLGQRRAAIELWRSAIALDSDFAMAHAQLGAASYFGNDRPQGDLHYARALALLDRVTRREQLEIRASAEAWRGNREHAIELRQALLAEYPDDPDAWGDIGYDYMRLGRPQQAIPALEQQLARAPDDANALVNLATAYQQVERWADARRTYRRAFELRPQWLTIPNLNHEFGEALVLGGWTDEARAVYDTMRGGTIGQRAQGERSIGLLEMYRGRYLDARDRFRQAVVLSQAAGAGSELTEARNRLFLAAAERELGGVWRDSARREVAAAYALSRKVYFEPTFLMYLGKALVREGELGPARVVLDTLRQRARPDNPEDQANVRVVAGEIALAAGHADSAVALFRLAATQGLKGYVDESLARALAASGDPRAGAEAFESLAAARTQWYGFEGEAFGLTALFEAGRRYEQAGDLNRARAAYTRQIARWKDADSSSTTLRQSHARLAELAQRPKLEVEKAR
jgi:serine/threonine-protein kinase